MNRKPQRRQGHNQEGSAAQSPLEARAARPEGRAQVGDRRGGQEPARPGLEGVLNQDGLCPRCDERHELTTYVITTVLAAREEK